MSAYSQLNTYTLTSTADHTFKLYEVGLGYGGTIDVEIMNPPETTSNTYYITTWTTKGDTQTIDQAGLINKDYILGVGKAMLYKKLVVSAGEKIYLKISQGNAGNTCNVTIRGYIEPNY